VALTIVSVSAQAGRPLALSVGVWVVVTLKAPARP